MNDNTNAGNNIYALSVKNPKKDLGILIVTYFKDVIDDFLRSEEGSESKPHGYISFRDPRNLESNLQDFSERLLETTEPEILKGFRSNKSFRYSLKRQPKRVLDNFANYFDNKGNPRLQTVSHFLI